MISCVAVSLAAQPAEPSLDTVMSRVGAYVAGYGEKASLIVAVEKYIQRFGTSRPRQIVAEFAIVKAAGAWVGYRDVVEVDGKKITDRRDRLLSILADPAADNQLARKLSDESARYNVGPINRNFNVPTTGLLVFQPANLARFTFQHSGADRIDGVGTWKIDFTEVRTPTVVMTRAGRDVPMAGTLWVVPADGTVVRTRLRLKNFADATVPSMGQFTFNMRTIETSADVTVTYRRYPDLEMWLPVSMGEFYEGPIPSGKGSASPGRANTTATYSDFRQFATGVKINIP